MNLREVHLSSRSVIPVALALPINREPAETQAQTELMQRQREANTDPNTDRVGPSRRVIEFYL